MTDEIVEGESTRESSLQVTTPADVKEKNISISGRIFPIIEKERINDYRRKVAESVEQRIHQAQEDQKKEAESPTGKATALYYAAKNGRLDKVKKLVEEEKADVNHVLDLENGNRVRPLIGAALCQDEEARYEIIKYLLEQRADPNFRVVLAKDCPKGLHVISNSVLDLVRELTDPDEINEEPDGWNAKTIALLKNRKFLSNSNPWLRENKFEAKKAVLPTTVVAHIDLDEPPISEVQMTSFDTLHNEIKKNGSTHEALASSRNSEPSTKNLILTTNSSFEHIPLKKSDNAARKKQQTEIKVTPTFQQHGVFAASNTGKPRNRKKIIAATTLPIVLPTIAFTIMGAIDWEKTADFLTQSTPNLERLEVGFALAIAAVSASVVLYLALDYIFVKKSGAEMLSDEASKPFNNVNSFTTNYTLLGENA